MLHPHLWFDALFAFFVFCVLSGCTYIINDAFDAKKDSLHPIKRKRPIASGRLKPKHALICSIPLAIITILLSFYVDVRFALIALLYFSITLAYNFWLKRMYLVDVLTISTGMVLRAVAGCVIIDVMISPWLILCTFLMALYLALAKRRHEILLLNGKANDHRSILQFYSVTSLDMYINASLSALVVSYCLYTFFSNHLFMMLTIAFALYGIFRYNDHIYNEKIGGEAELIFKDAGLIIDMVLWLVIIVIVLLNIPETLISLI